MQILGIILAAIYVLFIPGFVLSFVFFKKNTIDILERSALSLALSIAVVPLLSFYLNLIGIKISKINIILEVAAICIVALIIIFYKQQQVRK